MWKNMAWMGQPDICPDRSGKLETAEDKKKEEKITKENVKKIIRF
jgi:hypothetical protein